ncbi:hypothetical protein HDV05_008303 [Chytridiales sp. JEL 0842]|nr:hypothetical protein HDV05_008303 [Chytridiales sp. JEL 0842]
MDRNASRGKWVGFGLNGGWGTKRVNEKGRREPATQIAGGMDPFWSSHANIEILYAPLLFKISVDLVLPELSTSITLGESLFDHVLSDGPVLFTESQWPEHHHLHTHDNTITHGDDHLAVLSMNSHGGETREEMLQAQRSFHDGGFMEAFTAAATDIANSARESLKNAQLESSTSPSSATQVLAQPNGVPSLMNHTSLEDIRTLLGAVDGFTDTWRQMTSQESLLSIQSPTTGVSSPDALQGFEMMDPLFTQMVFDHDSSAVALNQVEMSAKKLRLDGGYALATINNNSRNSNNNNNDNSNSSIRTVQKPPQKKPRHGFPEEVPNGGRRVTIPSTLKKSIGRPIGRPRKDHGSGLPTPTSPTNGDGGYQQMSSAATHQAPPASDYDALINMISQDPSFSTLLMAQPTSMSAPSPKPMQNPSTSFFPSYVNSAPSSTQTFQNQLHMHPYQMETTAFHQHAPQHHASEYFLPVQQPSNIYSKSTSAKKLADHLPPNNLLMGSHTASAPFGTFGSGKSAAGVMQLVSNKSTSATTGGRNRKQPSGMQGKYIGMEDLVLQNDRLRAQVAAAKAVREREEMESSQMLETLNRLMGMKAWEPAAVVVMYRSVSIRSLYSLSKFSAAVQHHSNSKKRFASYGALVRRLGVELRSDDPYLSSSHLSAYRSYTPSLDSLYDGGSEAFPSPTSPTVDSLASSSTHHLLRVLESCANLDALTLGSSFPGSLSSDASHLTLVHDAPAQFGSETLMQVTELFGARGVKKLELRFLQIPDKAGGEGGVWGEVFWREFVGCLRGLKEVETTMCDSRLDLEWLIPTVGDSVVESLSVSKPLGRVNESFMGALGRLNGLKRLKVPFSVVGGLNGGNVGGLRELELEGWSLQEQLHEHQTPEDATTEDEPQISPTTTASTSSAAIQDEEELLINLVSGGLPNLCSLTIGSELISTTAASKDLSKRATLPSSLLAFSLKLIRARKNYHHQQQQQHHSSATACETRRFQFKFCGIVVDINATQGGGGGGVVEGHVGEMRRRRMVEMRTGLGVGVGRGDWGGGIMEVGASA